MEGDEHGFRVVLVQPGDDSWVDKVLNAAGKIGMLRDRSNFVSRP